jgi:MFS family permease
MPINKINNLLIFSEIAYVIFVLPTGFFVKKIGNKNSCILGLTIISLISISGNIFYATYFGAIVFVVLFTVGALFFATGSSSFAFMSGNKNATSLISSIYYSTSIIAAIINQFVSSALFTWEYKIYHTQYSTMFVYITIFSLLSTIILLFSKSDKKLLNKT